MAFLPPSTRQWLDRAMTSIAASKEGPTAEDLAAAPELDLWCLHLNLIGELELDGNVKGHPILGDEAITTSPLVALDPNHRWARTVSRWYKLGRKLDERDRQSDRPHRPIAVLPAEGQVDLRLRLYIEHLTEMDQLDRKVRNPNNNAGCT